MFFQSKCVWISKVDLYVYVFVFKMNYCVLLIMTLFKNSAFLYRMRNGKNILSNKFTVVNNDKLWLKSCSW